MIPVGYADGFRSGPRNWGEVLINGKRARLVGRVGMDRSAVDVTHMPDVTVGDEVVLIGNQGRDAITVEDVARRLDCTNYEVVTSISAHIPRLVKPD
jgi:alanine racemase